MSHPRPIALYVHWPFCLAKCPYCDFNSHVREKIDATTWQSALLTELDYYAERTQGAQLSSIFFGGGTPSLMPPETVAAIISRAKKIWPTADDIEVTLEVNPTSSERDKFAAFKASGVNRLSIGVQSLNTSSLKFLGRQHSADEAQLALSWARELFERFSFDLIYALPDQTPQQWENELRAALQLARGHMSLYQLTIEQGTKFFTLHQRGDFKTPNPDDAATLYDLTTQVCAEHGLHAYEVSNYAAPLHESAHNLNYWRYGEYVGVGPGAHGRVVLNGVRHSTEMIKAPELWLDAVNAHGVGLKQSQQLSAREQALEALMMGLRLTEGVEISRLEQLLAAPITTLIDDKQCDILRSHQLLCDHPHRLTLTPKGRLLLNRVVERLVS